MIARTAVQSWVEYFKFPAADPVRTSDAHLSHPSMSSWAAGKCSEAAPLRITHSAQNCQDHRHRARVIMRRAACRQRACRHQPMGACCAKLISRSLGDCHPHPLLPPSPLLWGLAASTLETCNPQHISLPGGLPSPTIPQGSERGWARQAPKERRGGWQSTLRSLGCSPCSTSLGPLGPTPSPSTLLL